MKRKIKIFAVLLCFAVIFSLPVSASAEESEYFSDEVVEYYASLGLQGTTINVYNWGEYISDGEDDTMDVVKEFEKLTGCKVNYTTYESNENMYSKISGGGVNYDIVIPSDYMIERMIGEGLLEKLDFNNIPNLKYIDESCKGTFYDPNNEYSVTYNVGTTVLIYNKTLVDEVPDSWEVLWDEQYRGKVLMFNNSRDAFAIAQAMLGISLNSTDTADWDAAAQLLKEQKQKTSPVYVMDEVFVLMESGEYAFAPYYAGDYELMVSNNPDLGFAFPKEGVNIFYDAMCVPKGSQNKRGAEAFINFMQEPEVALANAEYIYYATPNKAVREMEDYSLVSSEAVYPKNQPKSEYFKNLPPEILEYQNKLWTQVKESNFDYTWVYISVGAIAATAVVILILRGIANKKKQKIQDLSDLYN